MPCPLSSRRRIQEGTVSAVTSASAAFRRKPQHTRGAGQPPRARLREASPSPPLAPTCQAASSNSPFTLLIKNKMRHSLQELRDPPCRDAALSRAVFTGKVQAGLSAHLLFLGSVCAARARSHPPPRRPVTQGCRQV